MDKTYPDKARRLVREYIIARLEKTDSIPDFDTYVVWFAKVLQNWKALISTTLPDGMYYEVTYNGDKNETYIDAYKKFDNVRVNDSFVDEDLKDQQSGFKSPTMKDVPLDWPRNGLES